MAQIDRRPDQKFRGRATIRDIADLAGVSIATVSRVLNDRPDVAPGTRETVMQVVREHGFSTNRGARALSSGRTGIVGGPSPPHAHLPKRRSRCWNERRARRKSISRNAGQLTSVK